MFFVVSFLDEGLCGYCWLGRDSVLLFKYFVFKGLVLVSLTLFSDGFAD